MISDDTIKKTICKNIIKYRKLAGLSQKEFASKLGAAPSRVSSWETGANSTDIDTLFKICEILNVSINDMLEVYPDANVMLSYLEQEHIKKYRFISTHSPDGAKVIDAVLDREYAIADMLRNQQKRIEELEQSFSQDGIHNPNMRLINYYYRLASAGTGQLVFDTPPTKRIEIPDTHDYKNADYAIGVNGNSMEPIFHDGDMLLIEVTEDIQVGEIGIFLVDGESFVKKLGDGELISLNPKYDNIPLREGSKCMGRVIGSLQS